MAYQLEHYHAPTYQLQHGLLLGLHLLPSLAQGLFVPSSYFSLAKPSQSNPSSSELDDRTRIITSPALSSYSFTSYLAYALYPPLYLAGPIITFNAFLSQLASPPFISRSQILRYAGRFLACLLTMELVLHSMYVVAIKDESRSGAWMGDTPFELSMIGFWNLIIVWLKVCPPPCLLPR